MYDDDDLSPLDLGPPGRPRSSRPFSSRGAIYHLSVRTGTRSKNQSARAAAAYIQREQEYARGRALAEELVYAESGHMPSWAEAEPSIYWEAADEHERANGRLFKRVEMALPLALTEEERRELAIGFAHYLTDREHLPYTLAIHAGKGTNPHAHLLISERGNDGLERSPELWFKRYNAQAPDLGGAQKSTALHPKAWLEETRAAWAEQTNLALERAGHAVRIDHRSLEAQGIDRLPGLHLGPVAAAMEARGIETVRGDAARAVARENAGIRQAYAELDAAEAQVVQAQERQAEPEREPEQDRARTGRGWEAAKELLVGLFFREVDAEKPPEEARPSPIHESEREREREQERKPSPAEVARNPAVEERIAQIQDPEERAKAWKLLEVIRSEVVAQERPREREREREQERGRDRDDFEREP